MAGLVIFSTLTFAQYPGSKRVPSDWRKGFDSIKESDAKDFLGFLAGPELRGRGSLSTDYWAAAGYVAGELRRMGLKPAGESGSYFQRFDLVRATAIPEATWIESQDGSFKIPFGPDFQTVWQGDLAAKVKFAFVNIPEKADLASFDWSKLKGRWVVYSPSSGRNPGFTSKFPAAREELGVEQMIGASLERLSTNVPARMTGVKDMPDLRNGTIGSLRFSRTGALQLATKLGATKFAADNPTEIAVELPDQELVVRTKSIQEITPLVNVLAKLEGSDPALAKEVIAFGSHLDHIGPSNDGIRYGADDNASGCTANLLIAKAFLTNPIRNRRSLLFCFWAAEEAGVYGSFAYAMKPAVPAIDTVAYINMDMLGRNEETGVEIAENNVDVVYPGTVLTTSRDFYDRLIANNAYVNLRFKPDKTDRTNRSDTRNFVWKEIPTVKVFTGEHPDYHRAGDTIDKINWTKLINISKWLYLTAADLAVRPDRPKFAKAPFVAPDHYVLSGRAILPEKFTLPAKAKLIVELVNGDGKQILKKEYPTATARSPFEMLVPKSALSIGSKHQMVLRLLEGSRVTLQSSPIDVPATGWARAQEVMLIPIP